MPLMVHMLALLMVFTQVVAALAVAGNGQADVMAEAKSEVVMTTADVGSGGGGGD